MDFIDVSGHLFTLPSYSYKPIGFEYDENEYTFWIDSNNTNNLSINNYYMRVIYAAYDLEDDYDVPIDERLNITITIDSKVFQLVSAADIDNNINNLKSIYDYFDVTDSRKNILVSSVDKYARELLKVNDEYVYKFYDKNNLSEFSKDIYEYDENGNIVLYYVNDNKEFVKYTDDIVAIKTYTETPEDIENFNKISYVIIPIYVIGYTKEEGTWSTNILIHIEDTLENTNTWCPITVGGTFVDNEEALIINGQNMGVKLPKDILRAVYKSSFYNDVFNEALFNTKMKEYMLNYMNIKGECGNFRSAIYGLNWFGYGDKITISKLFKTDNEFQIQYIHDYFNISYDMLRAYRNFRNSTLLSLQIALNKDIGKNEEQNFQNGMFGEWTPELEDLSSKIIKVKAGYENEQYDFIKPYYDFCLNELGLKLSCLKYFYERYFLPIHLGIHSASLAHKVYTNDIKLTNKVGIMKSSALISTIYDKNKTVIFPNSNIAWFTHQKHYVDDNYNEFTYYRTIIDMNELLKNNSTYYNKISIDISHKLFIKEQNGSGEEIPILMLDLEHLKCVMYNFNTKELNITFNIKDINDLEDAYAILSDYIYINIFDDINKWMSDHEDELNLINEYKANHNEKYFTKNQLETNAQYNKYVNLLEYLYNILDIFNSYINDINNKLEINKNYKTLLYELKEYDNIEIDHNIIYIDVNGENKETINNIVDIFNTFISTLDIDDDDILFNDVDNIKTELNNLLNRYMLMNKLYYINDTCVSIPIIFKNYSNNTTYHNCTLILENEYGDICHESHFSFINNEYNTYKNFIIYPKHFNRDYENNKTKYLNDWIDHKFMLHLNDNGRWYSYEFKLQIPPVDIKLGKLEYKYYLNSDRYLLNKIFTHDTVSIIDKYNDEIEGSFNTKILSSNYDYSNIQDHSWEWLTNFCQIDDITDDEVVFNSFMWHPKLAEINNILFGQFRKLNDTDFTYNKLDNSIYNYTSNINVSDKYLNLIHIYDIYTNSEYTKEINVIPSEINVKKDGIIYKTYLNDNNELVLSAKGKYNENDNTRKYIYKNLYNNEFSLDSESLFTLSDEDDYRVENPHHIFSVIYNKYSDFKENLNGKVIKTSSDEIIENPDITKLFVNLSNDIIKPPVNGQTGRQWPYNHHNNELMYYYVKDDFYIYPLKYKYKYVVKRNNEWVEYNPTIYEFNFTSQEINNDYQIQVDFYYNEYYIIKHAIVWEDELSENDIQQLQEMHMYDRMLEYTDTSNTNLIFKIGDLLNNDEYKIKFENIPEESNIQLEYDNSSIIVYPNKVAEEIDEEIIPKIYLWKYANQRFKYEKDEENPLITLKVGRKEYKYGSKSKNIINLYNKFFKKHYEVKVGDVVVKNIFDQLIDIPEHTIDYDFYLMHDDEYWYGVFISKETIGNYIDKNDLVLNNKQKEFEFNDDENINCKFKHIGTGKQFLLNRMRFVSSNGNNTFNNDDIIVGTLYNNQRLSIYPYIQNSKWSIDPITYNEEYKKLFKPFTSNAEMVIFTKPDNNQIYQRGYYNVNIKYCINGDYNVQQFKKSKFKIL